MLLLLFVTAFFVPLFEARAQAYGQIDPTSPVGPYPDAGLQLISEITVGDVPGAGLKVSDGGLRAAAIAEAKDKVRLASQEWWFRRAEYLKQQWGMRVATALFGGLIDAMSMIAQRIAYEAASDLLTGNPGDEPRFWSDPFGTWLENQADDLSSQFIDRLDTIVGDWTQATMDEEFRFSFCTPPDPLSAKLSLGIGEAMRLGRRACGYKQVAENFAAVKDMIESRDALQLHRPSVAYGASDLSVGVEMNSAYFNYMLKGNADSVLERNENKGWKAVTDAVSGKISLPTALAEDSYKQMSPLSMTAQTEGQQKAAILGNYFLVGLENIPLLALNTFTNTLIVGLLHKWLDPSGPGVGGIGGTTPEEIRLQFEALKNVDASGEAQDLYQRKEFAKALGDYLLPNFASSDDLDIITELTTCNTPRKRFNCAMDQALGVAIQVGTKDGALTVGRAVGLGSEGASFSPSSQALHADWELIPENDIKNNTDPTCAQRAYCAGNLKKMRLSRIIPVGWEMAANSAYNVKKNGRYITLGEVIRGFYDCNAQGELDKDHPWCHLIDPNWVLTAPKYQCRAKGYGDAILPEIGSRLEECGDMVSCLGTSQTGECTGGYGYCLAERPVWKFESRECDPQFVSCRTYNYTGGQVSVLRNTVDRGKCSEENMSCMWYATERYAYDAQTPDGLWVGTATTGPRLYMDNGVEPCSSEGCTKVYQTEFGKSALNLVANSSFENAVTTENAGVTQFLYFEAWQSEALNQCLGTIELTSESNSGAYSSGLINSGFNGCSAQTQMVSVYPNRNYTLSFYYKAKAGSVLPAFPATSFFMKLVGQDYQITGSNVTTYENCSWDGNSQSLLFSGFAQDDDWHRLTCNFISPNEAEKIYLSFEMNSNIYFDDIQLEESEVPTPFIDGLATGLKEMYLKIAPDEYKCTGNDQTDHPACARFARVCSQIDVGCQGYTEVDNPWSVEIPAKLSAQDLCPPICAGYGEYRKLASSFDLVRNPADPDFDDPEDETVAFFIPSLADKCSLQDVGCEPFTNMEAASAGGESVDYYKDVRLCQKPNEKSATYFTWEGSDVSGYQLRTWSLISSATDPALLDSSAPLIQERATLLGYIKDPANCNDLSWEAGLDPDCRQFYDAAGNVHYAYYSQTVSSDARCTEFRKDESSLADCQKTGGEFVASGSSCTYHVLPSESLTCPSIAGGCRAYLGPTGRNAVNVFEDTFATGTSVAFAPQTGSTLDMRFSDESVLVGDRSLRLEAPAGQNVDVVLKLALSTVDSLMRVSFWAKTDHTKGAGHSPAVVRVDGQEVGTFYPDINWARFEFGPFAPGANPMEIEIISPSNLNQDNLLYIDTFSVDELRDIQFVRKNRWAIPLACDATSEGTPLPRAMVGCRAYNDRDGNTAYARNFSGLCRETAIGCKGFIDTNSETYTYPRTYNVTGTPLPSDFNSPNYRKTQDGKNYEEQFYGDWSFTGQGYRYYYAIDDSRARCTASENGCRAYGKPVFRQDRQQLETAGFEINPSDINVYQNQTQAYKFETVLLKQNLDALLDENGEPNLACRKDELFCDRFQSGNITEYFRDPGNQKCVWHKVKRLEKNEAYNIPADGEYSGWFREGTDIPCYPSFLASGNEYLLKYSAEDAYAGWVGQCPLDQSECTEFVDPNDTSDTNRPDGRPYYMINGPKLDKRSCGGVADPLSGCVLFRDKSVGTLEANSRATYEKVMSERGAPQTPIDCAGDPENEFCQKVGAGVCESRDVNFNGLPCQDNGQCGGGVCQFNDSNVVIKVKMDRECARWMGCRTGETVYDPGQQKFVTQCTDFEICQKNGGSTEDIYCAEFTDRDKENYLTVGQFVTPESYSSREVGFGKLDYAGYVAPNHYLLADTVARSVGFDLLETEHAQLADKYKTDKRLMAAMPVGLMQNVIGERCQDPRTGRTGYVKDGNCYLPVSEAVSYLQAAQGQLVDTNLDADQVLEELKRGININNARFQAVMPAAECQIYPEESSPLSTYFVQTWNMDTNPPTPKEMVPGFASAKTCVYGEDCSCSYRKARYSDGTELYYGLYGASPTVGICKGGTKAGQPCVNRQFIPNAGGKMLYSQEVLGDFEPCGPGGTCQEFQDLVIVNGKYAYCFERDLTRTVDAPQALAPCLTWAPLNPVGRYNPAHNAVTAGYMPPQGRGEYFCVAGTQNQTISDFDHQTNVYNSSLRVNEGMDFQAPGFTSNLACSYRRVMTQKSGSAYANTFLHGNNNVGTQKNIGDSVSWLNIHDACRRTMLCQGKVKEHVCSDDEGLWIQTGPDHEKTYSEYFIPYRPALEKYQNESYYDYHYGMFRFFPVKTPDAYSCKWNPVWIGENHVPLASDGFSCSGYLQEVLSKSNQFYQTFTEKFPGILDRRSEDFLRDSSDTPLRLRCQFEEAGTGNGCYYKFWEVNYNVESTDRRFSYPKDTYEDQLAVSNPINPASDPGFLNPSKMNVDRCSADHPYFSIRAMFQNVNLMENSLSSSMAEDREMNGPWQFVGFWVTACAPYQFLSGGTSYTYSDSALMYLKLQEVKVDACNFVAQTVDPYSRESIPFADRVWSGGAFVVPYIGAKYSRINEPFGSAVAAAVIGKDPMIMGDSIPASSDPRRSPTFPDSGQGMAADFVGTDMDSWFSLTNLFARIYGIWKWDTNQIYPDTPVCADWPDKKGTDLSSMPVCMYTNSATLTKEQALENIKLCSGWDSAVEVKNPEDFDGLWRCNALSGVNRGLSCGRDPSSDKNTDPLCHNAPVMFYSYTGEKGTLRLEKELYGSCQVQIQNSRPVVAIQGYNIHGEGIKMSLNSRKSQCTRGLIQQGEDVWMLKPDLNLNVPWTTITKQNITMTEDEYNKTGVGGYYQDYLYTAENIQKFVDFLINRSYDVIFRDWSLGFVFCSNEASIPYKDHVYTKIKNEQPVIVDIGQVAEYLLDYVNEARTAKVTVESYAERQSTDPTAPNFDSVLGLNNNLEARIANDIVKDYFSSHIDGNGNLVLDSDEVLTVNMNQVISGFPPQLTTPDPKKVGTRSTERLLEVIDALAGTVSQYNKEEYLIPRMVNFGPFDYQSITGQTGDKSQDARVYVCGSDSVEPGLRCRPDYQNPLGNGIYESKDCPKVIKPSPHQTLSLANIGDVLEVKNVVFNENAEGATGLGIPWDVNFPKQGFCFKGLASNGGNVNISPSEFYNWIYHTVMTDNKNTATYADDPYKDFFPNTGYCLGFNTASRCVTNNDCTFNTNQWWGMHDETGGLNSSYYAGLNELKIFDDSQSSTNPTRAVRTDALSVRLPTPYKSGAINNPTFEQVAEKFTMEIKTPPLVLNNYLLRDAYWTLKRLVVGRIDTGMEGLDPGGEKDIEINEIQMNDQVCGSSGNRLCVYFEQLEGLYEKVSSWLDHYTRNELGEWSLYFICNGDCSNKAYISFSFQGFLEAMGFLLRTSYIQVPNEYAARFEEIYAAAYEHNKDPQATFDRRVTLAPFVVDFWPRFIGSLGYSGSGNIYYHPDSEIVGAWGNDDADDYDMGWNGGYEGLVFYNQGQMYLANHRYFTDDGEGTLYLKDIIREPDGNLALPEKINQTFFWKGMNFSNVFSSLKDGACHQADFKAKTGTAWLVNMYSGSRIARGGPDFGWRLSQYFDLCDYFGFADKYRGALEDFINHRLDIINQSSYTSQDASTRIELARSNLFLSDANRNSMQYDYYDKVGWGLVMREDHEAFNLYPGVIPAGVAEDPKNNVYLPAHCEPAVGAIDEYSKFEDFAANNDFPYTGTLDEWKSEENWSDRAYDNNIWLTPRKTNRAWDATLIRGRLFLMPWTDTYHTASVEDFHPEHGLRIEEDESASLFKATYSLAGENQPFTESDFVGVINGNEPAGSFRTAWECLRTGHKVFISKDECNQDLIDKGWDYDEYYDMLSPQNAFIGDPEIAVRDLCTYTKDLPECTDGMDGTFLPPDYVRECIPNSANPDEDCDRCTALPGFKSFVNKYTSYELGNPVSTNRRASSGNKTTILKEYPSATDVTSGLDDFEYLADYSNTYQKGELIAYYQPMPPRVAAPDAFRLANSANAPSVYYLDTFSVNNNIQGVSYLGSDKGMATVRFYAWAAHDQAPLRKIVIDWGDGQTTVIDDAKLKNRKPICNTDRECSLVPGLACTSDADCPPATGSCLRTGRCEDTDEFCYEQSGCGLNALCKTRVLFGNSSEACQQGYFEFTHVYETKPALPDCGTTARCQYEPNKFAGDCRPGEGTNERMAPKDGCYDANLNMVRYTPRVMVMDNWNWCTGNCKEPVEPTPFNFNNLNRYPIRHPNLGCWDGTSVRYNTDPSAKDSPYPNECSENNEVGRPWVVFQGSVELSVMENN